MDDKMKNKVASIILIAILYAILLPILISGSMAFSPDSFLTIPTKDWTTKWFIEFLDQNRWTEAFLRSFSIALGSMFLSLFVGLPLAYAMTRLNIHFKKTITTLVFFPFAMPPIILGMGSLPMFYMMQLNGTNMQIVFMHSLLILPVVYLILKNKLESLDSQIENAALGLGAGTFQSLWLITLPLILPSIATSGIAGFVISMNESMVTLFMAGPTNETIPTITWSQLKHAPTPLVAVASIINLSIILIVALGSYFATTSIKNYLNKIKFTEKAKS